MNDQGYTTTLEGFIARLDDLVDRLRDAMNGGNEFEMLEIADELEEELARAGNFIKTKREEMS
jgi:hypothetical protein